MKGRIMRKISGKRLVVAVGVVVATGALGACGSSSSQSSAASSSQSSAASSTAAGATGSQPPATAGTYKLVVIAPISAGPDGAPSSPEVFDGAEAAAEKINASGGVNGRSITIVACDTKGIPTNSDECGHTAVADNAMAVVGAYDLTGGYYSAIQAAGMPSIAPYGYTEDLINPVAYPISAAIPAIAGEFALLSSLGMKKIAFAVADTTTERAGLPLLLGPIEKGTGAQVDAVPVESDQADFSPIVTKTEQAQAVASGLAANQTSQLISAAEQAGSTAPIAAEDSGLPAPAIAALGSLANGVYIVDPFLPATFTQNAAVEEFDTWMDKVAPQATKDSEAENAYESVELFAAAAAGHPSLTRSSLIASLNKISGLNLGLGAPIQFTKPSSAVPAFTRMFNTGVVFTRIQDGKLVPLSDKFVDGFTGKALG